MEEKCEFFDGYRVLGNDFFAEGRYQWAEKTYSEAVTALKYGIHIGCDGAQGGPPRALPEKAAQLLVTLLVNSAMCCLKQGAAKQAIEFCDAAEQVECFKVAPLRAKVRGAPTAHAPRHTGAHHPIQGAWCSHRPCTTTHRCPPPHTRCVVLPPHMHHDTPVPTTPYKVRGAPTAHAPRHTGAHHPIQGAWCSHRPCTVY
jgi:hypothetical protein